MTVPTGLNDTEAEWSLMMKLEKVTIYEGLETTNDWKAINGAANTKF